MSMEDSLLKAQQKQGIAPERSEAEQELIDLGIEVTAENVEMVLSYKRTKQVNEAEKPLYELAKQVVAGETDKVESLKAMMQERGIKEVVHAEGPVVWDHVCLGLKKIDELPVDASRKRFLKIIFLYHDIGKTDETVIAANAEKNQNPLNPKTGQYNTSFIGHADFAKMTQGTDEKVKAALRANGLSEEQVLAGLLIISKHMSGGVIDAQSKLRNSVSIYNEATPEVYADLIKILKLDGQATIHIDQETGVGVNETKANIDVARQLENIKIYNEIMALVNSSPDESTRVKREQLANIFFNKVNNFDVIDDQSVSVLKDQLEKVVAKKQVEIPSGLKPLGRILRDKSMAVAERFEQLQKAGAEERVRIFGEINLTSEQIDAVTGVL